jgi:hypothetical protein
LQHAVQSGLMWVWHVTGTTELEAAVQISAVQLTQCS